MKKLLTLVLSFVMVFSLVGCGGSGGGNTPEKEEGDSLSRLTAIWDTFGEDQKFACFGGNQNENPLMGEPGKFDISDTDGMTYLLLIPESVQANVDDAASLIHMMNANNFTGVVFHVKDGDTAAAAEEVKNAVLNNQFMCGSPEKLVVITSGSYVLYAFGLEQEITTFENGAKEKLDGAEVVYSDFF